MKIFLDDEPAELQGHDLATLLGKAQEKLAPQGRTIVEIQIDGQVIAGDALNRHLDGREKLGQAEVHLYTADPRVLAVQVLGQVQKQLDVARQAQDEAAEAFQQDKTANGITQVGQAVNIWLQVQQAVTHSSALAQVNLNERKFEDQPVSAHIQQLLERIRTLRDLLTQRDTLGLADTLAYEWAPMADLWQRLIGQLILWIQE